MGIDIYIYIAVMAVTTSATRILPLMFIRKEITNVFLKSFLYYVPYVTLAVMTFPSIMEATESPFAGALALCIGVAFAWIGANLFQVAILCCSSVFICELISSNYF